MNLVQTTGLVPNPFYPARMDLEYFLPFCCISVRPFSITVFSCADALAPKRLFWLDLPLGC
jgi:hypothetical protein